MLKILVVVSCFPPSKGGVENSSYRLAMGLADQGHRVTVVTSSRGKSPTKSIEQMGPLRVIRFPERYFLFEAPLVPRIAFEALFQEYDVLHVHGMTPPITDLAILFAKMRGKSVVLTYHNDAHLTSTNLLGKITETIYSKFAIPVVSLSNKIVSSTHSYALTSPVLRHLLKKVVVIPWGTNGTVKRSLNQRSNPKESKKLLFVGQLKDYKGVDILLQAVSKLNQTETTVTADIVGFGPAFSSLRTLAAKLTLLEQVRFWGEVNDETLGLMFDNCDALVLPSINRREAFGLVQLEAFAAGRTVVASDIPGVKDIASMGKGYLAKPNDVTALCESISRAIRSPVEANHVLGVAETLSWKNVVSKYEKVLLTTVGKVPTQPVMENTDNLSTIPALVQDS